MYGDLHQRADGRWQLRFTRTLPHPVEKAARDGAGWHTCLDALQAALGERENDRDSMDAWRAVHPHYVESFGPEAAMIGPPEGFE
jgi:hypothetical protein